MKRLRRYPASARARWRRWPAAVVGCALAAPAAADAPPLFNWVGLYLGASFCAGFPLNGRERWPAVSGYDSPAYGLFPPGQARPEGRRDRRRRRLQRTERFAHQLFRSRGLSVDIGEALTDAAEKNFKTYYKLGFGKNLDATFDYQLLADPAYNAVRGPINVFGLRLRAAF
jgi:hypothetical protein